jgi:lipopolysaccharide transport system ATP-binding protein
VEPYRPELADHSAAAGRRRGAVQPDRKNLHGHCLMSNVVIQIEDLWKEYRLGVIGHGTLTRDLQSWWARARGKEDPNSKIMPMLAGQEKQIEGDRFWALSGINLEVKEGEILGIIGKNGAGKSTLLKILSRVTAPTKGQVKIKGRIASLLEVGTGFHPELTGRENIFMNGAILGMSKQEIRSKLDEIIDFSGVEKFIDTPVKRYSSGMYVRLAFAVAAHLEPEILVIDEVLAVGDAEFQKKCLGKMGEVSRAGRTVLFVSHNMAAINSLCQEGIFLMNGTIQIKGEISYIIDTYTKETKDSMVTVDLCNRKDRRGTGWLKIIGLSLLDAHTKKIIANPVSGSNVMINIDYIANRSIKDVYFGVSFSNAFNMMYTAVRSDSEGIYYNINENIGSVYFLLKWPFTNGRFYLSVNAQVNNILIDSINNAIAVDSEIGDYFGNGKIPASSYQIILLKSDWMCDKNENIEVY